MAKISKTSTFEVPKIFSEFFCSSFRRVLPVAWPRAAAPEATHLCTGQSSDSSRRRRTWMLTAMASEEDIGGETS